MIRVIAGDFYRDGVAVVHTSFLGKPKAVAVSTSMLSTHKYPIQEIVSCEIITQSNSTSIFAKAGWGALGAVALGPVGLLAGVIGGGNRSRMVVAVEFADGKRALLAGKPKEMELLMRAAFR